MKITFLTTQQAYWGGSEELWVKSAKLAIQNGHQVQAVVYNQKAGLHPLLLELRKICHSFVLMENESSLDSLIHRALNSLRNKIVPANLHALTRFSPDCIFINQAHNYSAPFHPMLYKFLLQYDKPFYLISQFNAEHLCLTYADVKKARIIFDKAAVIFFVSHRNKTTTERQIARNICNASIIDNSLNLTDPTYITYPVRGQTICFASVARFEVNFKGQDILLQILSQTKWKNRDWHLSFYGNGADEQYLKELCLFYEIGDRVSFEGHVNDVKEIWGVNHALLLPSVAEGKPLALQEAMICGRIGIASDVGGNAELIDDGVNGYIASSFFPKPFDEALERGWKERGKWKLKGQMAHEKMIKSLDLNPHVTLLKCAENPVEKESRINNSI